MEPGSFHAIVQWTIAHGYPLMFVLMLVEGPAVTAAGAFGAALGHFNIFAVMGLAFLGNLIPDIAYYSLGYFGRRKIVDRWGHYLGFTEGRIKHLDTLVHGHAGKAIVTIKLVPLLATPGLVLIGTTRMPLKKYARWSVIMNIASTIAYATIGYYFGAAYDTIDSYIHLGSYAFLITFCIAVIVYFLHRRYSHHIAKIINKDSLK